MSYLLDSDSTAASPGRVCRSESVGIALVGAGIVANLHARGILHCPNARLVGVLDTDERRASLLAEKFDGRCYGSLSELLDDPAVQAVHVLTPVKAHVEVGEACLAAGRHVLVEKPVAGTVAEIERLAQAAHKTELYCVPGHNYIHQPSIRRMRRLLQEGAFGTVGSLWVLFNILHDEATAAIYGGVLRAVCVHHAYSLLYLLGRPESVVATASSVHYERLTCEDQVMITASMPNGAIANLWASFVADDPSNDPWTVTYKLIGTKGVSTFSWADAVFTDGGGPAWGLTNYVESFEAEIDYFVNRCIRGGEPPLSSLQDAADALRIVEACEASLRSGSRATIDWNNKVKTASDATAPRDIPTVMA